MPVLFDLDDTGLITHPVIVRMLKETHGDDVPIDKYLTPDNGGSGFIGLMESGEFLDKVAFREDFFLIVDQLIAAGVDVGICTHRGYHPMGQILTRKLFTDEQWDKFTYKFFLDPRTQPDKLEFLFEELESDFVLVDDRPHFNSETDDDDFNHVILFDQPWNKNLPFERVYAFDQKLVDLIFKKFELIDNF